LAELFTPAHILIIVILALVFFGPSKLPQLGRATGLMLREFKSGLKGLQPEDEKRIEKQEISEKIEKPSEKIEKPNE
jgi:sec-independent protein translocase protein TatA